MSINNTRNSPTANPCIGRCTTTTGDLSCKGCGRTVAQIRDWNSYSDAVKLAVKREAAARIA